ncbi:ATP-binding protein [Thermodesulfovibrio thiophilus]|uniref:ATP-binding protein n=1 Tax=Thermodesulfovibrio thiophilus TaxID=340095 RepID=UPI0004037FBE|nr:ATP-binding protein [Thermodesulfovibrio thiophilus]
MFRFITQKIGNKLLLTFIVILVVVMFIEISFRIYFGLPDRLKIADESNKEIMDTIFATIKHPLTVGDSETIHRDLEEIASKYTKINVYLCDFNKQIAFSTDNNSINKKIDTVIDNKIFSEIITEHLAGNSEASISKVLKVQGKRNLISILPIKNSPECFHCHGSSKNILGAMILKTDVENVYLTVQAQMYRSLTLTVFAFLLAIVVINFVVNRLIKKPLHILIEATERFSKGEMSTISNYPKDEIGTLCETFNCMVNEVAKSKMELEKELTRRARLLEEREELVALLQKANQQLKELDILKSSFIANMSHELRTPMNAIIGYTDLLLDEVDGPLNEEQKASLKKVAANARHLLQLINDVLDISKIESGKIEIRPKEVYLKELIDEIIVTFEPLLTKKGLTFSLNIEPGAEKLYIDEDKAKQIFINLISNAVKFTNQGGITLKARVSERGKDSEGNPQFVEISVSDTGIGIKREDLDKIFDKFAQADVSTTRQYEGTGLGLSIVRGLVALHKGMVWAESEYGKGSTFYLLLPFKKEVFERPGPVTEEKMAEVLAQYFEVPKEVFLQNPTYEGKLVRCWDYTQCGHVNCPEYGSSEKRCWLALGTHCKGMKICSYPEKTDSCRICEVVRDLVLHQEPAIKEVSESSNKEKVVLAIDDNPDAIDLIRKYLEKDYKVIGILNSEEAAKKAKELKPVAITLDIMMPKKDGWQVLKELKSDKETQNIPVVIVSIIDNKTLAFSLGAADYFVKPLDGHSLLKKIKSIETYRAVKKVFILEKDETTVKDLLNVLKQTGYDVSSTSNSKEAIEIAKNYKPDLLIVNITDPDTSAYDFIDFIKTSVELKDIPMIALTDKELTDEQKDVLNGRIKEIINKSLFSEEQLITELKNSLKKIGGIS